MQTTQKERFILKKFLFAALFLAIFGLGATFGTSILHPVFADNTTKSETLSKSTTCEDNQTQLKETIAELNEKNELMTNVINSILEKEKGTDIEKTILTIIQSEETNKVNQNSSSVTIDKDIVAHSNPVQQSNVINDKAVNINLNTTQNPSISTDKTVTQYSNIPQNTSIVINKNINNELNFYHNTNITNIQNINTKNIQNSFITSIQNIGISSTTHNTTNNSVQNNNQVNTVSTNTLNIHQTTTVPTVEVVTESKEKDNSSKDIADNKEKVKTEKIKNNNGLGNAGESGDNPVSTVKGVDYSNPSMQHADHIPPNEKHK